MAARKKKQEEGGTADWALSYGDMMTLLCTFFILIVSFSTTELIKFRKAMGSMRGSMGVLLEQDGASIIPKNNSSMVKSSSQNQAVQLMKEFEMKVFQLEMENGVEIEMKKEGFNIRLNDDLVFSPGTADLNPSMYPVLDDLGLLIHFYSKNVRVEGHTDNLPMYTSRFGSNWELSSARAISVVRYFVNRLGIDPTRFAASGCGQYRPLLPNTTPENRRKNRRVEIFIELKDGMDVM